MAHLGRASIALAILLAGACCCCAAATQHLFGLESCDPTADDMPDTAPAASKWKLQLRAVAPDAAAATAATHSAASVSGAEDAEGPNPLLNPDNPFPLWDQIRPEHIVPGIRQLLAEESASLDLLEEDLEQALAARPAAVITFDRVFKPFTQIRLRLDFVANQVYHLSSVVDSSGIRSALEAVTPELVAFELRFGQSRPVFDAISALRNSPGVWAALDGEQQRVVTVALRDMTATGVGLPEEERARFNALKNRLEPLIARFGNNVQDSVAEFKLLIRNKSELDGLSPAVLAAAARKAREDGHASATPEDGPWLLGVDSNTVSAVLSYASNRDLRRQMHRAYTLKATSGATDNTPVIDEILTIRYELAQLMGFKTWADYRAASNKIATFGEASARMKELLLAVQDKTEAEVASLTDFARNQSGDPQLVLEWSDVAYWTEKQQLALFSLSQDSLKAFLPLEHALDGLFKLLERLYGVMIIPTTPKPPVWHPDVLVFSVYDTGAMDQPIAHFYADLFARPGEKGGGAWASPLVDGAAYWLQASPAAKARLSSASPDGSRAGGQFHKEVQTAQLQWLRQAPKQAPIVTIVCNQPPPADGKPSLMSVGHVETIFHEMGHALQHMLTTTKQGLSAGIRNIENDAIEIPSMMQEKWVWDSNTFSSIARHWQTGQPIPADMTKQLLASQKHMAGFYWSRRLTQSLADLRIHSEFVPGGSSSASDIFKDTFATYMPYLAADFPGDRPLNSFGHIFGSGYDAGYYSYQWADIMSADIFEAFEDAQAAAASGKGSAAAVVDLGRRYRATVLASGGSDSPNNVFQKLMGRHPKLEAILRYNGVI